MLERRALLFAGLSALAAATSVKAAPPPGGRLAFAVMRKGRKIGSHEVVFSSEDGALTARARCEMTVALGPVALFRYRHSQVERWAEGRFVSLQTDTTQNGKRMQVSAKRTEAGVSIQGGGKGAPPLLGADALPLTHWNRASLTQPLFNPQDGKPMRLAATRPAPVSIVLANGASVQGTRVVLSGEQMIENWYDGALAWAGLKAKAEDGSIIEYRRV